MSRLFFLVNNCRAARVWPFKCHIVVAQLRCGFSSSTSVMPGCLRRALDGFLSHAIDLGMLRVE